MSNTRPAISPFSLSVFSGNGVSLQAITPMEFTPEYDDDFHGYTVAIDDLDLFCTGPSKGALIEDIMVQITFDWTEYVLCEDAELDGMAIQLKNKLKSMFLQLP